jgi:hypothetical protein
MGIDDNAFASPCLRAYFLAYIDWCLRPLNISGGFVPHAFPPKSSPTHHTSCPFILSQDIELIHSLAHRNMSQEFTLFPQLITELRLEVWRLALPEPLNNALYPYKKGCWLLEDLGIDLDPNGEDLNLRFDTSLLEPLDIGLSLYSVNREAHSVAVKYIRKHKLVVSQDNAQSDLKIFRNFDPSADTMFLPTCDVDFFVTELAERIHEPDLFNRNVSTPGRTLLRLAVTPSGFKSLMRDALEAYADFDRPADTIYVVDVTCNGRFSSRNIEDASRYHLLGLEGAPYARLTWHSSRQQWSEITGDGEVLLQLGEFIRDLDEPRLASTEPDFEVQLVHVAASGKDLRSKGHSTGVSETTMDLENQDVSTPSRKVA